MKIEKKKKIDKEISHSESEKKVKSQKNIFILHFLMYLFEFLNCCFYVNEMILWQ